MSHCSPVWPAGSAECRTAGLRLRELCPTSDPAKTSDGSMSRNLTVLVTSGSVCSARDSYMFTKLMKNWGGNTVRVECKVCETNERSKGMKIFGLDCIQT